MCLNYYIVESCIRKCVLITIKLNLVHEDVIPVLKEYRRFMLQMTIK
jgi:hypothetical protein